MKRSFCFKNLKMHILLILSFKDNLARRSAIMKDQPETPLERAVFWTEYVIRHKGAPHLRSAARDLTWYQYHLIDVWAFIIFVILAVLAVIFFIIRALFRLCFGSKPAASKPVGKAKAKGKRD
jgi:glucuronosyltransferase